eukprot:4887362-Amphidinium_carterae.1
MPDVPSNVRTRPGPQTTRAASQPLSKAESTVATAGAASTASGALLPLPSLDSRLARDALHDHPAFTMSAMMTS